MKSNQVIFGSLSYSGNRITIANDIYRLTICSWFSKEDVYNDNVLLISVVIGHVLKRLFFIK